MIKKIGYKNIRVFKEQQCFDLAPLTILTGPNNSGKSTIHKMLTLLLNSFFKDKNEFFNIENLNFTGDVVEITGGYSGNVNYENKTSPITFSFGFDDKILGELEGYLSYKEENGTVELIQIEIRKGDDIVFVFKPVLLYSLYSTEELKQKEIYDEYHENIKAWQITEFNNNLPRTSTLLRDSFIKSKNKGFEQEQVNDLNEKIKNNESLTEIELKLKQKYENDGAEFNSWDASEKIADSGLNTWNIWDSKKNTIFEFDETVKKISEIFDQPNAELLFNTKLSELVLGKEDILNRDISADEDENTIIIKQELIKHNILTQDNFIVAYKEVELSIIEATLKKLNQNTLRQNPFDYSWGYVIFKFFFYPSIEFLNSEIKKVLEYYASSNDDVIAKLIAEEIIIKTTLLTNEEVLKVFSDIGNAPKRDVVPKRDKDKKETKEDEKNYGNLFCEGIRYLLKEALPVKSLLTDLDELTTRLSFSLQNKTIKRHFFNSDKSIVDSIFYEMGKEYNKGIKGYGDMADRFIEKWIGSDGFNIADKIVPREINVEISKDNFEHIGIVYYLAKKKKEKPKEFDYYPLADNGLGINYLVLLLLQIVRSSASTAKTPILVLEEPESNMHPNFQSKLAELFVDAKNEFRVDFIIETHSEYLIRKLQHLAVKKKLKPEESIIYYFNNLDIIPTGEKQIKELKIREDGMMDDDFGEGFFDEATKLIIDLLKHQNHN